MDYDIILDFHDFKINAYLFNNNDIANKFYKNLPYSINLTCWGNETYGTIGLNLGTNNPVTEIPCGGLAYTNKGNYFCIFYGQKPAWTVEYIGKIKNEEWKKLLRSLPLKVNIYKTI